MFWTASVTALVAGLLIYTTYWSFNSDNPHFVSILLAFNSSLLVLLSIRDYYNALRTAKDVKEFRLEKEKRLGKST